MRFPGRITRKQELGPARVAGALKFLFADDPLRTRGPVHSPLYQRPTPFSTAVDRRFRAVWAQAAIHSRHSVPA